jgi:phosphoribosylaminoimidazole-succinocarboxamide synthase
MRVGSSQVATPRPTRQERRAETRERLLEAAARVFARDGYAGASVEDVAGEAGFSTGALYSNFDGKEDLFLALLAHTVERVSRRVADAIAERPTVEERARLGAAEWMRFLEREPEQVLLFVEFWAYAVRDPDVRGRFAAAYAEPRAATARLIDESARALGLRPTLPAEQLATAVDALADGLALQRLVDPSSVPENLFGDVLSLLLAGASARAGEPTPDGVSLAPVTSPPTTLDRLDLVASGKVREMYRTDGHLLMVASDRVSTYDVVHPTPVPDKGKVLAGLSAFWFERTADICPNHLVSYGEVPDEVRGRALLVEPLEMFPVECVVRGYLTGSGWKDYLETGAVCGIELPPGLEESAELPEPIFTPATKAEVGDHDENVDFERAAEIVGDRELLEELRRLSLELYRFAAAHARERGIILADTKLEFGRDAGGRIVLGDEAFTPDSSRFWPADEYAPGRGQRSFDKQFVRDWVTSAGWDKRPPAPPLPGDVCGGTRRRYVEAYERITEEPFSAWLERTGAAS